MAEQESQNLRDLVAEVAAAYFATSHVAVGEIGTMIEQIAKSLGSVGTLRRFSTTAAAEPVATPHLTPAQIRKPITPETLSSFEDGRSFKTLRLHLAVIGLTPEQYRETWGLPND